MGKDRVQITIDVSDSPELRKAFRMASDELEVRRSTFGKFCLGIGIWAKTKAGLWDVIKDAPFAEKYYPLISLLAATVQLKEMGFLKVVELERLLEDVRVFLEKRRDKKGGNYSDA